ncbi:FtsQ-type POTRA domain-containing protein [Desulfococcaceae bacterium OttesenSCG-928-F15]|nr:FtsQ-type POTRA domain-containing protein [Desulfococcaceae bacterium OttesenSCG-928-F15]
MPWFVRLSGVVLLAFFFIFVHDALTQTRFLEIREIETLGLERLEREEVILHAGIPEKATLYGINLDHVRIRLEAHPFIREAKISRNLPAGLTIRIEEKKPFAILKPELIQEKVFLADVEGRVFKELEDNAEACGEYVIIRGLPMIGEEENRFWFGQAKELIGLWDGEMSPLLGKEHSFSLRVDPDLGIFVNETEIARQISFGRSDYGKKLEQLKDLMAFQSLQKNTEIIDRIDLIGNNRIVLVPVQSESPPAT